MGLTTRIVITCPINWWQQIQWIYKNCENVTDSTNWQMWQIGLQDVYFDLQEEDAIMFRLIWAQNDNT